MKEERIIKKILYLGNFSFPLGNAAGKRVYGNGKLLQLIGYDVIYLGVSKNVKYGEDLLKSEETFDGFKYYNMPYAQKQVDWLKIFELYKKTKEFIKSINNKNELNCVIMYGSPSLSLYNLMIYRYLKSKGITVISDCVDWLTVKTNNPIFNIVKKLDSEFQKRIINNKMDGLIVISKYLQDFYKNKNIPILVLPPLTSNNELQVSIEREQENEFIRKIVYAGQPFRKGIVIKDLNNLKDRVDKTMILLNDAKKSGCKFEFDIFGFDKEDYLNAIPSHASIVHELGNSVKFNGVLSNQEVSTKIQESDFTLLYRDYNRDSNAGFPTKISESISLGIPVITTATSDIFEILEEEKHGIEISLNLFEAKGQLQKALKLPSSEIKRMKEFCKKENPFYFKNYHDVTVKFLKELKTL